MSKRPLSVTVVGCVYIAAGAVGLVYHLTGFNPAHPFQDDTLWIAVVRVIAIVSGVYLLRGSNWARWLALAWIAYHVVLSAFHSPSELVMHGLLCVVFAYLLFRPRATGYFRAARA
jgi:hypothetical protein